MIEERDETYLDLPRMEEMYEVTMMQSGLLKCWNLALFTSLKEIPLSHDRHYLKTSRGSQWSHVIYLFCCENRGETRSNHEIPLCNCHNRPLPLPLEASFRSKLLYLSHPYKGDNCTRKKTCCTMKNWLLWFKVIQVFIMFFSCSSIPPTPYSFPSSILLSLLPPFCPLSIISNQKQFRGRLLWSWRGFPGLPTHVPSRYHPYSSYRENSSFQNHKSNIIHLIIPSQSDFFILLSNHIITLLNNLKIYPLIYLFIFTILHALLLNHIPQTSLFHSLHYLYHYHPHHRHYHRLVSEIFPHNLHWIIHPFIIDIIS